jgi:hypothetical protein
LEQSARLFSVFFNEGKREWGEEGVEGVIAEGSCGEAVAYCSPGLRRSRYPGKKGEDYHNLEEVAWD